MKRTGKKLALQRVTVRGLTTVSGGWWGSYHANCSESCNTCKMEPACYKPDPTEGCPTGSRYCVDSQAYVGCG